MTHLDILFEPYTLKGVTMPNRIAMAPMTRTMSPEGVPSEDVAAYYARRVTGGCGLIITEATPIEHDAAVDAREVPVFYGESSLSGWKKVCDAVHAAGGKIMPQLWHMGMMRRQNRSYLPDVESVGPSGLVLPGKKKGAVLTTEEIDQIIAAYAASAKASKDLGFDGVELHGAHGYLIDQFLWDGTNERTDRFGGDMLQRATFLIEVINAVRGEIGPDYPLLLRMSQWKQQDFEVKLAPTPQELEALLTPIVAAGVDMLHCSTRRFWEPEFEGSDLNFAGWAKKLTGIPTMSVGSVGLQADFITSMTDSEMADTHLDELGERMERGEFDMIAVGRALLANPDWANKIRAGQFTELKPYTKEVLASLA